MDLFRIARQARVGAWLARRCLNARSLSRHRQSPPPSSSAAVLHCSPEDPVGRSMELFAGEGGDCRFPEPPTPHGDPSMQVIRDALLSQLQRDRLRQEIIVAELAKIERAMALPSADAERAKPGAGPAPDHDVAANVDSDPKKKGGVRGGVEEPEPEKPAIVVTQCLKPANGTGNAAGQGNAALAERKLQESSGAMLSKKEASSSSLKWSCAICRVEAPTESHLQQHFVGQKHRSKVANLVSRSSANGQKAKAAAEDQHKPRPVWVCRFCQSNCTCKSDLENHLRGKRHKAKIQALLDECKKMTGNYASLEADSQPVMVLTEKEGDSSSWNCSLCQAKCNRQSVELLTEKKHT